MIIKLFTSVICLDSEIATKPHNICCLKALLHISSLSGAMLCIYSSQCSMLLYHKHLFSLSTGPLSFVVNLNCSHCRRYSYTDSQLLSRHLFKRRRYTSCGEGVGWRWGEVHVSTNPPIWVNEDGEGEGLLTTQALPPLHLLVL